MKRTLTLTAAKPPEHLFFRAAIGDKISTAGNGWFASTALETRSQRRRRSFGNRTASRNCWFRLYARTARPRLKSNMCGEFCADCGVWINPMKFICNAHSRLTGHVPINAQRRQPKSVGEGEDRLLQILRFQPPAGEVLEAGAIEMMPDGKIAVGTRRGEIWMIENALRERSQEGEVHALRPRPARDPRPGSTRTAGSTSRSAPMSAASRTPTATARPTCSRSSPTAGRSTATITNTPSARASTRTATSGSRSA